MGRQVLLWKTDFSGRIDGIRHGRSKSGQTTYFEPKPLMQANNYLIKLQEAEPAKLIDSAKSLSA